MNIQEYSFEDQSQVKKFVLNVLEEFGFEYRADLDYDLEDPKKYYQDAGGIFYVVKEGKNILGTVAVKNKGNGIAELKRMYLDPSLRGKGWGSQLFEKIFEFCRQNKFYIIKLDTWERLKKARHLYQKKGFITTHSEGEQIFMQKNITSDLSLNN